MTEALTRLKKIRAGHRSSASRLMNQLEEASAVTGGPPPDKLHQWKLSLTEKLDKLRTLNEEILASIDEDAIEEEIEQSDVFSERMQQSIYQVEQLILSKPAHPAVTHRAPPSRDSPSKLPDDVTTTDTERDPADIVPPVKTGDSSSKVKLPKLVPKSFNGDLTKWEAFWSTFESSIHLNTSLSPVDKFTYLNSLLEGSAMRAVAGLKLSPGNYIEAIATLKKRFGNKQQIISRHMDTLLELESVSSVNNIKALRRLYDQVEFQVRSLRSLEVPLDSYGNLLSSLVMNRLPQDLRLIISREVGHAEWHIDQLMAIVEREISARERAFLSSGGSHAPTTAALLAADSQPKCCYCRQGHPSLKCTTVTDTSQRKVILKKTGRCFVCLKRHHLSKDCRSSARCAHCSGRHHTSICNNSHCSSKGDGDKRRSDSQNLTSSSPVSLLQPPNQLTPTPSQQVLSQPQLLLPPPAVHTTPAVHTPVTTQLYCVNTQTPVLLQTAKAYVHKLNDERRGMVVRLMLDGGSQRSYLTQRVRDALGLQAEHTEKVQIKTFGSDNVAMKTVEVVKLAISLKTGNTIQLMFSTVPMICEPLSCQPIAYTKEKYSHLSDLDLADSSRVGDELEVDALIGSDNYWQLVTGQIIHGKSGPTAINTHLGWVLSGPVSGDASLSNLYSNHSLLIQSSDVSSQSLDSVLKSFWELESLGIKPVEPSVYDTFEKSVTFKDGRYEVRLPWRDHQTRPPSNLHLAQKRLQGLLKKLRHHPEILHQYHAIMQEQIRWGIIEKVSDESRYTCNDGTHYLPHHAVVRKDKTTTKLRIVYDASARADGHSLNDCLFAGPKFNQNILDIILRFRSYKVALAGDIEKAFLMVSVSPQDRDALRFLWVDDVQKSSPDVVPLRFARVVFGVSASPFLLNATISHHLEKYRDDHPELVDTLQKSIYVDDVTCGADGEEEAYQLYALSKKVFSDGGFNLRKFLTNSPTLRQKIAADELKPTISRSMSSVVEEDSTYTCNLLTGNVSGGQKVLGVSWNTVDDVLEFDIREIANSLHTLTPTKRNIVSFASRFYDPLGFLSPVIVTLKIFFQELCKLKLDWDDRLPTELLSKWTSLLSRFQGIIIKLPRCYFHISGKSTRSVLYGFCDASAAAYAAVVYLCVDSDTTCFVASKTRVSPLSQQTIPRLELLSCLLLARLLSHTFEVLREVVDVHIGSCFTDSTVALFWIKGEGKQWKQFVNNRVVEIRQLIPTCHWMHCSGKDNPADMPSRGISPQELSTSTVWRHGPDWLPHFVPTQLTNATPMPEDCKMEMIVKSPSSHAMLVSEQCSGIGQLIDCTRYSKLRELLRVTALVKQFAARFKALLSHDDTSVGGTVTATDMTDAEMAWVADCQPALTNDTKFSSWKIQLDLFLDQHNVWRCGGRLKKANLPYDQMHPILLPKQHPFTVLIVKSAHERTLHSGVKDTITEIRSKYWLAKGRQFVRKIIHQCVICRKVEGPHYRAAPPPPLPDFRVNEAMPFAYCGVDFAGPLYYKEDNDSGNSKAWISLYTCCVTRAVHLELVPDMTTLTFIRSFKRFCARRGVPTQVVSDNAKTFVSAAQTLQDMLKHPDVQQHLSGLNIQWTFNLEKAPWWGGFFERMIQSVKKCLKKSIGKVRLTYDELTTLLTEIEGVINSRPLSYLSTEDLDEPLTPSHLLTGHRVLSLPNVTELVDITDEEFRLTSDDLNVRLQHLTHVLDDYWMRWRNEYLLQLRERYSPVDTVGVPRAPVPGEVVIIHDENHPRSLWKLGKVAEVIKGDDNQIRGAVLDVVTNGKTKTLRRPINLLYPLEVMSISKVAPKLKEGKDDNVDVKVTVENSVTRPIRAAAQRARKQVLEWITNSDCTDNN